MAIDILGKTDRVLAHGPVRLALGIPDVAFFQPGNENRMRPGHMKWNYAHTFGELKPDVIVSIWPGTGDEAAPYLKDYVNATIAPGIKVYLRKDSTNILWERVILSD